MSSLMERATGRVAGGGTAAPRSPVLAGVLAAVQAAAATLALVQALVVLAWAGLPSPPDWTEAVRVGADVWLLAHHTGLAIPGGHLGFVPMGLLLLPLPACVFAGERLARGLDPRAELIRDGVGRGKPSWPPVRAGVAMAGSYSLILVAVSGLAATASVRPLTAQGILGAALLCGSGAFLGALWWRCGGLRQGLRSIARRSGVPARGRSVLRTALVGLALLVTAGLLPVAVGLVSGWDRVMLLHNALDPGRTGGVVLWTAQLLALPNAAVWGAAWLAGPGFVVGAGTSVSPAGTVLGAFPALPVLGALPRPGGLGGGWWAALAVPVLCGALATWWHCRRPAAPGLGTGATGELLDAVAAAVVAGAGFGVLCWLSGGPAGPGRMAQTGPVAWQAGLAAAGLLALGGAVTVGGRWLVRTVAPTA